MGIAGDTGGRERLYWWSSLALVVLIYSTLYFVRIPAEFLRERGLLGPSVAAAFALALAPIAWGLWRRRPGWRETLILASAGALLLAAMSFAELPEEKLHFLEYGLLGGLLFQATKLRSLRLGRAGSRGLLGAALLAGLLAALAGWADEGIQAVLPNRYYDVRDIAFNVTASSIAVAAMLAASWARERDLSA